MPDRVNHQEALVYVMVMMSAVDTAMTDRELERIGKLCRFMPVFDTFDATRLVAVARDCADLLSGSEGLDIALEIVREALPERLSDTAYAVAVEIAAADRAIRLEEIRLLQLLRDRLKLDKLTCAAIERSAMARFRR